MGQGDQRCYYAPAKDESRRPNKSLFRAGGLLDGLTRLMDGTRKAVLWETPPIHVVGPELSTALPIPVLWTYYFVIPEPSSLLMLGSGLLATVGVIRRKLS
jgi:hypothetical protein